MNYILDTHILLWWLSDDKQLSDNARRTISSPENTIYVSSVSAWEISIKKSLGKLQIPDVLEDALEKNNFSPLPITISHSIQAGKLPPYHRDPFDRMLIAQAQIEKLIIISHDKKLHKYKVKILD